MKTRTRKRWMCGLLGACLSSAAWAVDGAELSSYVEEVVTEARTSLGIPGIVVVIVEQGEVVLAKGWGYSRVKDKVAADPATTIWPVFSVTKPFTATAILQLVEEGKIGLDDPAEKHLGSIRFRGVASGRAITIRDLITQSSGLDEQYTGMLVPPGGSLPTLEALLTRSLPLRVRPAGEIFQYSIGFNHSLLGHILENVDGADWDTVMQRRILAPLGMTQSTFRHQAKPGPTEALGYEPVTSLLGRPRRVPYHPIKVRPAGSLRTTGLEMAEFLKAQLENGQAGNGRLLAPGTLRLMHTQQFATHPAMPGVSLGFVRNGRALEHLGGPLPHFSSLYLLPEERFGVFLATNAPTGMALMKGLHRELAARFYPEALTEDPLPPMAPRSSDPYPGLYRAAWRPRHGLQRFVGMLPLVPVFRVERVGHQRLKVQMLGFPKIAAEVTEVARDVFDRPEGRGRLAFHVDEEGVASRFVTGALMPYTAFPFVYERVGWGDTWPVQLLLYLVFVLAFLIAGPVALFARALAWLRGAVADRAKTWLWWLGTAVACTDLSLLLSPVVALLDSAGLPWPGFPFGLSATTEALLWLGPVSLALTLALVFTAARRGLELRVGIGMLVFVALFFLPWGYTWGMIGWQY